jgi:hypothetical protein
MPTAPYDPVEGLLGTDLDLTQPFTTRMASAAGLNDRRLARIVETGLLRRPLLGVYHSATLADGLDLRIACLRLVVPDGCVVTDRTAGWLHGAAMTQAPNSHVEVPRVTVFHEPGKRLRNALTASGERRLRSRDVEEVAGLRVTTPLRTACDLGRLVHRDAAFASLDALLRLGRFSHDELLIEVERFKGYRGVRQLRAFAPLADPGAESFGESVLRLRWYDAGMVVRPETQLHVVRPATGQFAFLDVGAREVRYAAEYDGARFHGSDREAHDNERRAWLRDETGWSVDVFRRDDVFGHGQSAIARLRAGLARAKLRARAGSTY